MWTQSFTKVYPGLRKDEIWRLWTDVNNWSKWHDDLDYCTMAGQFEVGNHFILKPKKASPVKIMLTDVQEERQFTDCTQFWGAKMYDTHIIEETPEGLRLTNTLVVKGPLRWLWVKLVAQNVAKTVPHDMERLVNLVGGNNG
jgi:hypothetical protein